MSCPVLVFVAGVKIGPNGKIWYVNQNENTVIRIDGAGININESSNNVEKQLIKVVDILGKEVPKNTKNQVLFYIFNNGEVKKIFNTNN